MLPSFLPCGPQCDFPLNNLAYGVVSTAADPRPRPAVAIADHVLDLRTAHQCGLLAGPILSQRGAVFEEVGGASFAAAKPWHPLVVLLRITQRMRLPPQTPCPHPHNLCATGALCLCGRPH